MTQKENLAPYALSRRDRTFIALFFAAVIIGIVAIAAYPFYQRWREQQARIDIIQKTKYLRDYQIELKGDTIKVYDGDRPVGYYAGSDRDCWIDRMLIKDSEQVN